LEHKALFLKESPERRRVFSSGKKQVCPITCTDHDFYLGDDDPENEGVEPGYISSVLGIATLGGESCMIFLEIHRDRDYGDSGTIAETVAHEVGHCLGLEHASYEGEFEENKDGIMGWDHPNITCYHEWRDIIINHTSPNRFSYQDMANLRSDTTD